MAEERQTKAILLRLKKELDGKLECDDELRLSLDTLVLELDKAIENELSEAKQQKVFNMLILAMSTALRHLPEIKDFFGE